MSTENATDAGNATMNAAKKLGWKTWTAIGVAVAAVLTGGGLAAYKASARQQG